jgi:RNA polymerase sigma-70 factor (ECF subfamily)
MPDAPEDSFNRAMASLQAGDPDAAAQVFHRFAQRLIALARSRLDSRLRQKVDPEDVLQSAYKSFFSRYAQGQFDLHDWNGLWSLLVVITLRKCGRWREHYHAGLRDVRTEVPLPPSAGESGPPGATLVREPTPAEAALLAEAVEGLLRGLEGRDRDITVLALQGYTAVEISTLLDRPERTVYRVLDRLKKQLQRSGAGAAEPT